jgi:serine protease Do
MNADNFRNKESSDFEPFLLSTCEGQKGRSNRTQLYLPPVGKPFAPFLIQDPFGLRNAIVPVFCHQTDGRILGMGTAFHVDGFGTFLTAHHVIDFAASRVRGNPILLLGMHAVVFGQVVIPSDCFAPATAAYFSAVEADDPLADLRGKRTQRPAIDVASINIGAVGPEARFPQALPVRLQGWRPEIGEIVLAVGFPQLDMSEVDAEAQRALISEGMFGAYGRITSIHPDGISTSNPSPVFEVESDWPSGMSGGPVFNRSGEVVGVVSRSHQGSDSHIGNGFAVDLGRAPETQQLAPSLDAINPGWSRCWGLFDDRFSRLFNVFPSRQAAEAAAYGYRAEREIAAITRKIGTDEFVRD